MTITTIADIKPAIKNARRRTERGAGMIARSIEENGFGRSVLLAADGSLIAGSGTIDGCADVGLEDVQVVDSDGTKIIAVRRTDVQPGSERAHKLAIADNRTTELSDFDPAVVAALANEVDLSDFWRDDELNALLASVSNAPPFDPRSEWAGMPAFEHDDLTPVKQIVVNFAHADDLERFAALIDQKLTMSTRSIWYPPAPVGHYADKAFVDEGEGTA
jgi:hypothetical protein